MELKKVSFHSSLSTSSAYFSRSEFSNLIFFEFKFEFKFDKNIQFFELAGKNTKCTNSLLQCSFQMKKHKTILLSYAASRLYLRLTAVGKKRYLNLQVLISKKYFSSATFKYIFLYERK